MSAMTPHIKVLRAEAFALGKIAEQTDHISMALMLARMGAAKVLAADKLESEEPKIHDDEHPIT